MEKLFLHQSFEKIKDMSFAIDYWDGTSERYGENEPDFKIIFNERISKRKLLKDATLVLGEAYMDGVIDYEGNLQKIVESIYKLQLQNHPRKHHPFRFTKLLSQEKKSTSLKKQKKDIQYHYDLGNDFYELWLDDTMSYSCAYFCSETDSLKQAQLQKIDHILKKLQLHEGETLLDIGSGWGWLVIRAAQQYGVKTMGITLSEEQFTKSKQLVNELGLDKQVDIKIMDYRTLVNSGLKFDKVVSVGMVEHVGRDNLPNYMEVVEDLLNPGGLSVLHCITGQIENPCNKWIQKYIFPGGYIPSIRELIWLLPDYDFHVIDIESLRLHYAKTLDCWSENFERNLDYIKEKYGERFIRMWRLYLNSCAASFRTRGLDIHQIVFSKGLNNNLPLTRHYLYQ